MVLRATGLAVLASILGSCGGGDGPPTTPTSLLTVELEDPAAATFVPANEVFILALPVHIRRPGGGLVESVETVVRNVSRGMVVATNRRPNVDFAYPETSIPASGVLTLEAGVGFPPPPPRDELSVTVEVRLTTGESASRTARLTAAFP